ncbi:C40 family peptidase [Nocardia sp. NBC_01503]|uniref:C40 family peptidase n=1 Tax=Nocardia sp. NBC_01503 TaxID=2975997 RepID=UPI002E7C1220|nr:C40 family peptidase [Nocardia sp. NBC_01503]WTL29903.1 C40 family peptidase [Nocardia sp. NBC_01503]
MATVLSDDLSGVLKSLLDLYGAGSPDPVQAARMGVLERDTSEGVGSALAAYTGARSMHVSIADSHEGKDSVVRQAVAVSGGNTADGRNHLTHQISDLQSRIQAIAGIRDTRFSGPALLDAVQTTITKATQQVDRDTRAAHKLAAQIMPPAAPKVITNWSDSPRRRRPRLRTRRRTRIPRNGTAGSNAVLAASNWLGTRYVWGGGGAGGPSGGGFDCSGLTQYAIAQASQGQVILPRTTYEQIHSGIRIPVSEARPGDLVFPAGSFSSRGPEHVQLAAGNGMVIEAPYSGSTVKWSRMSSQAIVVRVL